MQCYYVEHFVSDGSHLQKTGTSKTYNWHISGINKSHISTPEIRLSLSLSALTSWSFWGTSPVQMKRRGEGHVAPISERGDDETARVTQVLVAVLELSVCLPNHAVIYFL